MKNIPIGLSLNTGDLSSGLARTNKMFRAAFIDINNEAQKTGTLYKNLIKNSFPTSQYNNALTNATRIVGNSNWKDINSKFQTISGNMVAEQKKIESAIQNFLTTNKGKFQTSNTESNLKTFLAEIQKGIATNTFVARPSGILNKNVIGAKAYNDIVKNFQSSYFQSYGNRTGDYQQLKEYVDLYNKYLAPNGGMPPPPPVLKGVDTRDFIEKIKWGINFLDDEYETLTKEQANNKNYLNSYRGSNVALQKFSQQVLDMMGVKGYKVGDSTFKELEESLDEAYRSGRITNGFTIRTIKDFVKLVDDQLVDRYNTVSDRVKSVQNKNDDISQIIRRYRTDATTYNKTADIDRIEQHRENLRNVIGFKSDVLSELNHYKLNLSENYTKDEFNRAFREIQDRKDVGQDEIRRINFLNNLYQDSNYGLVATESKIRNAIDTSEKLVGENITAKNIENINERFSNLNQTFNDLKSNKEYQRVTGKKNFLENIFGKDSKISNSYKEQLTDLKNKQDTKLKELAEIAERNYGLKLHGDYSNENYIKAAIQAMDNSIAEGNPLTEEARKNIAEIGRSIEATNKDRIAVNNVLTADQQEREKEREEAVETQQFIHNMNALSQAAHRIGAGAWQGVMYGKGSVDEYVKYQSSVVGIAKLLPALRDQKTLIVNNKFKDFREGILNLTNRLPSSGIELAHSAEVAARLGVTNPDRILDMVDLSAKLGATFGMNPDDVTQQIVKIANGMGYNFSDPNIKKKILDNIADPINYLDDHTAASGREILNFTKKSVSIGKQVGMETRDVAAFGATLISLGITSDSAATAFKNLITVMQTGARNQKKGKEYLEKAGFTQQQLMEGMKKAPTTTALKFLQQLNKLKSGKAGEDAASIARFGFGQMSLPGILALVNNPKRLEEYLAMARSGALNWTEIEYKAKEVNDPAIRFATMQNKYKELQITLGEALMPLADDLIIFLKKTSNDLIPAIKKNKELLRGLGIGAIGTAGIANTTAFIADASIIMANLPLLSKFAKPLAIIAGELLAGALIFQGVRQKIVEPIVYKGMIKEEQAKNKAEEKTKGTIKDNTRRSQSQHGEIYTEKKYTDLVHRLNKKGYDAFINEDGQVQISKIKYKKNTIGQKEKIKGKALHFIKDFDNFTGERRYLTSNGWYIDVSEEQAPELFSIIDQIKREHGRLRSVRARNNILPKGVQRKSKYGTQDRVFASLTGEELPVSIGNLPDYNHMVDKITEERNNRIGKAQVTDSKIQKVKKAKEELDLIESKKEKDGYELFRARENLDIAKQELAQAEKDERKTKQHENKLIKDINGIPWQTPNAYRSYYDLDKNNKPNKKTPIEIKKQDDEKTKQRYLDFVKAQGFDSIESYNVEVQQRMVDYLSKQHQALKVFAGESNDPKLNKYKDLNAYYDPSINPYGYYGIERTAELLDKAKQKLEEYKKAYNDFQKDNPNNPLSDFYIPENPWQNLFASPQEDTDKSINNNFGKLNNFLKIDAETKEGLVTVNKNTEKVQTSLKGINEAMPSIVANFDSWGKTDSSLALIDAHTSSILKNLQGINSIKDLTISIGIDLGQKKHSTTQT